MTRGVQHSFLKIAVWVTVIAGVVFVWWVNFRQADREWVEKERARLAPILARNDEALKAASTIPVEKLMADIDAERKAEAKAGMEARREKNNARKAAARSAEWDEVTGSLREALEKTNLEPEPPKKRAWEREDQKK